MQFCHRSFVHQELKNAINIENVKKQLEDQRHCINRSVERRESILAATIPTAERFIPSYISESPFRSCRQCDITPIKLVRAWIYIYPIHITSRCTSELLSWRTNVTTQPVPPLVS